MSRNAVRQVKRYLLVGVALLILLAGCSNPLSDDDNPVEEAESNEPTATAAATMPIVTPTPIDPTAVAASANQTPGSIVRPATYIVEENDTLYGIAAKFDLDIAQLVEENDLSNPNDIFVGQELSIPNPE